MTDSTASRPSPLLRAAILTAFLVAAWLLWSGLYKPLLLGLGVFSCALTVYLLQRMGYFSSEAFPFRYSPRLLGFWGWLGKEIVVSSLEVARHVLAPKIEVAPRTVRLDVSDLNQVDQALLGNSITLTPGTLALDVHEGTLLVHSLTEEGGEALKDGEMLRRVRALRGR